MKKACGIIVFKPTDEDISNILLYTKLFDTVIVYLNSVINDRQKYLLLQNDVLTVGTGNNDGLSVACDAICKFAIKNDLPFVMLFDQDSRVDSHLVKSLYQTAIECLKTESKVGIVCPRIQYGPTPLELEKTIREVDWCITSGSLMNLSVYDKPFHYDNNYFIDRLDRDYCKQLIMGGYKIIMDNNAILHQKLGETRVVLGKEYSSHSVQRHYYIARNRLYYNKKFNEGTLLSIGQSLRHLYEIIVYENDKLKKISGFCCGIYDFYHKRFGGKQ